MLPVVTDSVCAVVGSLGLTMQFYGTVSKAPVILSMHSQCSHTLMSASYVRRMNTHVEQDGETALQVAVANGMACTSTGTCKVRLKLQEFAADLTCHVVELADAYEVILGDDRLGKYSASLSWEHKCCVLTKGSQRIRSVPGLDSDPDLAPVQPDFVASVAPLTAVWAACHAAFQHFWQCLLMLRVLLMHLPLLCMTTLLPQTLLIGLTWYLSPNWMPCYVNMMIDS